MQNSHGKQLSTEKKLLAFLVGECRTGAGGEGGPRGIFLLILKKDKSIKV